MIRLGLLPCPSDICLSCLHWTVLAPTLSKCCATSYLAPQLINFMTFFIDKDSLGLTIQSSYQNRKITKLNCQSKYEYRQSRPNSHVRYNEDKKIEIKFLLKNISYLYHSNEHELCYQEHSLVQQTF